MGNQKKLAKRNQPKLFECYCSKMCANADAAVTHAKDKHPEWHYYLCLVKNCLATVNKVGVKHSCKFKKQSSGGASSSGS